MYSSTTFDLEEASEQLHTLAALTPRRENPIPIR
jgi:hypothetical protein